MSSLAYAARDSVTMFRRNMKRAVRYPSVVVTIILMPVLFLLLFTYAFGGALGAGIQGPRLEGDYIDYIAAVLDPPAASLGELLSRADLVVVGRVVQVAPGRVLSDPGDPDRAVRTQFAQLEVDEVTRGSGAARLVLEEVAALADGTPATVAGLEASRVGDAGLYLLVHGDDGRVGLVGPQGRYLLVADDPDRLRAPPGGDPLARRLADLGPRRLRRAVLGAASR
jgi:hypothetical protein